MSLPDQAPVPKAPTTHSAKIAIIGGTGVYDWPNLSEIRLTSKTPMETPYGLTSAVIKLGNIASHPVAFLPRHGDKHQIPPHRINYRANLYALQQLGVEQVIALNAVGGIAPETLNAPTLVIPDQVIDYTHGRISTFFDQPGDPFNHIDFTEPFDASLRAALMAAAKVTPLPCIPTGTYGCTQGPRLESRAEIQRLERDGCSVVGMTAMPEAALARELEMAYASLCITVNPAAGKSDALITMAEIQACMAEGLRGAVQLVEAYFGIGAQAS